MKTIGPGDTGNNIGQGVTPFPKRAGSAARGHVASGRNTGKQASLTQLADYRQAKMKAEAGAADQKEKKPDKSNVDFSTLQGEFGSFLGQVEEKFSRHNADAGSDDKDDGGISDKEEGGDGGKTGPSSILSAPFSPGFAAGLMAFGAMRHAPKGNGDRSENDASLSPPGSAKTQNAKQNSHPETGKLPVTDDFAGENPLPDIAEPAGIPDQTIVPDLMKNSPASRGEGQAAKPESNAASKREPEAVIRDTKTPSGQAPATSAVPSSGVTPSPVASPAMQVADRIAQEVPNLSNAGMANTMLLQTPKVMSIKLHPEGMGDVSVRLSSSGGRIKVSLDSDLSSTSDSLKAGSAELVKALQQVLPGFSAENLDFSSRDQASQNQASGQSFNNPNFAGNGSQSGQLQHGARQEGSFAGGSQGRAGSGSGDVGPQPSGVRRDAAGDIYL